MNLLTYLKGLLPSFDKNMILDDARITKSELKEFTYEAYETSLHFLGKWKWKSEQIKSFQVIFSRMLKVSGNDNMVTTIHKSLKMTLENLEIVEQIIEKTFNEEIASSGLTYLKANLLQFTEAVGFVSKYARKLLIYIYICETACYESDSEIIQIKQSLSPAEIKWLQENFVSFCTMLANVSRNGVDVKKVLENIPDIVITDENGSVLRNTIGENKIDPFEMRLVPIWMNPIYRVGMFVAEWQAKRYNAAKEEVKLVELRKLNLEKLTQNKPDARIQKEIEYMETRIQDINFKLAKMEEGHHG